MSLTPPYPYIWSVHRLPSLTGTTNRNGQSISFTYDALNRLISKSRPPISTEVGPQVTTFGYDSVGNLTSVADPDSTVANGYDLANRLTSTTASMLSMPARILSYGYDLNGNRTAMTDPQGGVTNYVYDSLNRLTSVTNPSGRTTSFAYDVLGRRTSMTHANGIVTSYSYDAASQLTRLAHQLGATTINSFDYTYDRVGNRKTRVDRNGSYNYTYDTLNRLTQAINPLPSNPLESYTYDPVGNRTTSNQNGASTFNQANQLTEDASFTYQYDNNGNLTRKTAKVEGGFTNYEYDAENKLARVVSNGTVTNYRYDGLGRRLEKETTQAAITKTTRYVYDNEDILLELDGSNNIVARYTHGPGIDEPLIVEKAGAPFFYHADGLGSITEITDTTGAVKQRYTYSSFGKIESQLDPNFIQPYTFTAREFDLETDLYHYRQRQYDWKTGRFAQEDPQTGFTNLSQSLNRYPYVGNNPVNFVDPLGLQQQSANPCDPGKEDCGQDFLGCLSNCIQTNDPLNLLGKLSLTILGGTVPKSWVGMPRIGTPVTTILSRLSLGQGTAASGANVARIVGRIFSPIWIGYGVGLAGVEAYCVGACAGNSCAY